MATMTLLTRADSWTPTTRSVGHQGDHHHGRRIDHRAGEVPGVLRGVVVKRRSRKVGRHDDAEVSQKAHDIAGPADGDGGGAERVFQDQIPADDPGDELAERRIGVSVGAAGDRDGRGHLGVAQPGAAADHGAEQKRQRDRRTGIGRGGVAGENEDAGADDGADAEPDDMDRGQAALERHPAMPGERLDFRIGHFRLQRGNGFAD